MQQRFYVGKGRGAPNIYDIEEKNVNTQTVRKAFLGGNMLQLLQFPYHPCPLSIRLKVI